MDQSFINLKFLNINVIINNYYNELLTELELVQLLLSANASLTCVDIHGRTPLHLAVNASQPDSILFDIPHYLIENKADLSAVDKYGRIPLHYAFLKVDRFVLELELSTLFRLS